MSGFGVRRRDLLAALAVTAPLAGARTALASAWHNIDVAGYVPSLSFDMTDATTGKPVTAEDFRGKLVLLYLGYTQCPDVCPLTLQRVAEVLQRLGKDGADVRLLFVTVDPDRDTLPVLKQYTAAFSPAFVGLRGDANQIARIARRYRLAYSVTPATKAHPYEVTHSSAIYVFGHDGSPKLLIASLATTNPDIAGTADDLRRLLHAPKPGLIARLSAMF
ncbi:MAG TPA: SCO family protein [Solirubrobacteraceae bacterium]